MRIMLKPGDTLEVGFYEAGEDRDYELDGKLTVAFIPETAIRVISDMPDTTGRTGVVYEELFGAALEPYAKAKAAADAVEETRKLAEQALAEPRPAFDPAMYRVTPEGKARGDKLVADNLRACYKDRLAGFSDAKIADTYEIFHNHHESPLGKEDHLFREYLGDPDDIGEPEPGEHSEVLDAIASHNDGEER